MDGVNETARPAPWNPGSPDGQLSESCTATLREQALGYIDDTPCDFLITQVVICQILQSDCAPFECPIGSCMNSVTGACYSQSPPGYYGVPPNVSSGQCYKCPKGSAATNSSATSCHQCEPGRYAHSGSDECFFCPSGTFAASAGQGDCEACGFGSYVSSAFTSCEPCAKGRYSDSSQAAFCSPCHSGKWSDSVNASTSTICKGCPQLDSVSCEEGAVVPIVSGSGYYRNLSDAGSIFTCHPSDSCADRQFNYTLCTCIHWIQVRPVQWWFFSAVGGNF
eukprot:TRINITY_DN10392_c0_g1_i9.p1 TRINITY_DN10392_c0_g1~~TRINITY_DN10392_c0_g1_i9.p1  ORF type:complete len:279 (+),score=18.26 TRINITY_DN10392_c0_g1_i9:316-1152(+)